ncbi:MAG: 4Fe-4S dicluster domain-containing protein [Ignavibacterium sp.]|jgi:molybdopterin-containing oxidoreductase family iron-sulfur binding subunit
MMKNESHNHDFPEDFGSVDRRSFLRLAGFTFAGVALAGCEQTRIDKAIPYLIKPEEITPGKASWYASTCRGCPAGCGILVKNREGRPIKIEGNPDNPVSRGGVCAIGQAMVLGVYDSMRLTGPVMNGSPSTWENADRAVAETLQNLASKGSAVRILTGSLNGPTEKFVMDGFLRRFANAKHIVWNALSQSAILDAHRQTHGTRALPRYRFDKADVIVSFDADFLGTWISPVEFTRGYTERRSLKGTPPTCSYHVQVESRLSLTGAKADKRIVIAPAERLALLQELHSALTGKRAGPEMARLAKRLQEARGRSLVVCGSNDLHSQLLVNAINQTLGNYGATIDLESPSYQHQSDDRAMHDLMEEMKEGKVGALFVAGVNPVADLPNGAAFAVLMKDIPLVVSFADHVDETAACATMICPDHHFLESWSDAEPVDGVVTVNQPVIAPLGNTRSLMESLAMWSGRQKNALQLMQEAWFRSVFPRRKAGVGFQEFWDRAVHDGFVNVRGQGNPVTRFNPPAVRTSVARPGIDGFTAVLYPKVTMLDGRHAQNAWLHEIPDPVTKITWDNYAILSPATAEKIGVMSGDVVRLTLPDGSATLELPAWIQPGQHESVIAVALGYGRKGTERFAAIGPKWLQGRPSTGPNGLVGVNASALLQFENGAVKYERNGIKIEKTGRRSDLACTQTYHSVDSPPLLAGEQRHRRPLVQLASLEEFAKDPSAGSHPKPESRSLWPEEHRYDGYHWGMVIDLNACTGCAACVVSCQAENNIPVVGKDEVLRNREMHWLRIDRYFIENEGTTDVVHQPMLCHHCDNAPCETVCPVQATVHSSEGLNQQVYNRCVGTRYCANNCPYKIRRFNWFDYPRDNEKENMVLNPDVTVRSRGVMEKCSFCVQRIQEARIEAKRRGTTIRDDELKTACEQSCPAQAIVFGDLNNPETRVSMFAKDPRQYQILAELEVRPTVSYMTVVKNRPDAKEQDNV